MPYIIAAVLLVVFVANVTIGAVGTSAPLGTVAEMLILFAGAIAFSVGILRSEAREMARTASRDKHTPDTQP